MTLKFTRSQYVDSSCILCMFIYNMRAANLVMTLWPITGKSYASVHRRTNDLANCVLSSYCSCSSSISHSCSGKGVPLSVLLTKLYGY